MLVSLFAFFILTRNQITNTIMHMRKIGIWLLLSNEVSFVIMIGGIRMNFFNRKNQKRIATAICILVIVAMVVPIVLGAM